MRRLKLVAKVLICMGILSSFWGCHTVAPTHTERVVEDDAITAEVKTKLLDNPVVNGLKVGVHTYRKVVTLTGTVNTTVQKNTAVQIARSADGVLGVDDNILVDNGSGLKHP